MNPNEIPLQRDCLAYYGDPRPRNRHEAYNVDWAHEHLVSVRCPWALNMGPGIHIPAVTIHKLAAPDLVSIFAEVWDACGKSQERINALHYDIFSGSFVPRAMRTNEAAMSMHFFGAAIDHDAPHNGLHRHDHALNDNSPLVAAYRHRGWIWGGEWSGNGVDAMHFQRARVHS